MDNNLVVLGNESSVIYYNLNKQFSTIKKIIITKEIILNSFEDNKIKEIISSLQEIQDYNNYLQTLKDAKANGSFDSLLKNDLYKQIQDSINKISEGVMDVQLKDYNFMSSVSNTKFNVTLRTEGFSLTHYYQEKGAILSAIRQLIQEYLEFSGNIYRLQKLDSFQIEIYETEEIYKNIILKKEGNSLLLSSAYGFTKGKPCNYTLGPEFYFSIGEDFKFYENTQTHAILRDHTKLTEQEINHQEKILSNEDLVLINKNTKNINDALIEMYLDKKGHLRIVNLSLLENSIYSSSEQGFIINKSSKNYNRISLITLRDNVDDELPNPKYLIIRNDQEINELFDDLSILSKIDGLIFTSNFYLPVLDSIGQKLDLDILYSNEPLQKSLDVKIDLENFSIEGSNSGSSMANPFSNIIGENNKEKDQFLEKLKNIDLSTPQNNQSRSSDVENLAQSIISSPNASTSNNNGGNNMDWPTSNNSTGSKKSAIAMLADSVMNTPQKSEEKNLPEQNNNNNNNQSYEQPKFNSFDDFSKSELIMNNVKSEQLSEPSTNPFDSFDKYSNQENTKQQTSQFKTQNTQNNVPVDIKKYESVLATKLLTSPSIPSGYHFADMNNITELEGGEIYLLITNKDNMANPNFKYVLPIGLNSPDLKNCYLLINNTNEYFLIDKGQEIDYFINITEVNPQIKKNYLKTCYNTLKKFSLIVNKTDIELLDEFIDKIENVYIKDIQTDPELLQIEKQVLAFEKRHLMKNN